MEYLAWLFFCLSPFALFCSENGSGLILCPVFIILGFVFKRIGSNSGGMPKAVVEIEPQKYWEYMYKDYVKNLSGTFGMGVRTDNEARGGATSLCRIHHCWVPPESIQEQIARECGITTALMMKERKERKDRLQIGKYFLMLELEEKYRSTKIGKGGMTNCCFPRTHIEEDIYRIKSADDSFISDYWSKEKYNKSIREMWESLSNEEKNQATKWIEEYEKELIEQCNEYVYGDLYDIDVKMDF